MKKWRCGQLAAAWPRVAGAMAFTRHHRLTTIMILTANENIKRGPGMVAFAVHC